MSDFNQQQYSQNYQQYLESNKTANIGGGTSSTRVALFKKYVSSGSKVFEIGSGGGEDSIELQKAGFLVTASDYVEEFVTVLKERGLDAVLFDAKNDSLPKKVDAIYANAVFVHFSKDEIVTFLNRMSSQLVGEKVVFFTVIKGFGSERSARSRGFARDFYYYDIDSIQQFLSNAGHEILSINDSDEKWIQVVAKVRL